MKAKQAAVKALEDAWSSLGKSGGHLASSTRLDDAGRIWLAQIQRADSGLSPRTVDDYSRSFSRYIDAKGSPVRGLTLAQLDASRLRAFLQGLADDRGTGAAKSARAALSGILGLAVSDGVLPADPLRSVRPVKQEPSLRRSTVRDHTRAFTRQERDHVVSHLYKLAGEALHPSTQRKAYAVADLVAFLAGTGARIDEARELLWQDVDLEAHTAVIRGSKSKSSLRAIPLPLWLVDRLRDRAARSGTEGRLFPSPHVSDASKAWDQSNSAKAVRAALDAAGAPWAVPHTMRRTVASLLHEAGVPLVKIADQLGHADPAMTASVYLGRDLMGHTSGAEKYL
ncbi:hypothetical protein ASG91_16245 [Phycicoccus sp. Soil802]|nr:hypothetical protein ASG91_16245 [Phycicoccus sp. Soil802]